MSGYRVVYVEPGKPAVEKEIGSKLEDLQEAVGGLIECIYSHRDGTLIVANDEAKLLGMEGNRRLDGGSIIAGPFFVIGDAGENFRSLTDAEVSRYLQVSPKCASASTTMRLDRRRRSGFPRRWQTRISAIKSSFLPERTGTRTCYFCGRR